MELKKLEEHDQQAMDKQFKMRSPNPVPNGIACPYCSKELFDTHPNKVIVGVVFMIDTHCECGYKGVRAL